MPGGMRWLKDESMKQIESRVSKLEQKSAPCGVKLIMAEDGETDEQAIRRAGFEPDAPNVQYLVLSFIDAQL